MPNPVNRNLRALWDSFGNQSIYAPEDRDQFEVDGVEFVCDYQAGSTAERFFLVKPARSAAVFRDLAIAHRGAHIVELGIAEGGSTALLALLAQPTRLLAVDIEPNRMAPLDEFIERRGLAEQVRTHYGVDQADKHKLLDLVERELEGVAPDLVIDDASHLLAPTTASFEVLFPLLRPGGTYIIEDWSSDLAFRASVARAIRDAPPGEREIHREQLRAQLRVAEEPPRPLLDLVVELILAHACGPEAGVGAVQVDEHWVTVHRNDRPLESSTYRLADHWIDPFGYLA